MISEQFEGPTVSSWKELDRRALEASGVLQEHFGTPAMGSKLSPPLTLTALTQTLVLPESSSVFSHQLFLYFPTSWVEPFCWQ